MPEVKKKGSLIKKPQVKPKNDGFAKAQPPEGEVLADDPRMKEQIDMLIQEKESEDMKEKQLMSPLVMRIKSHVEEAESARLTMENQWLRNLKAYRAEDHAHSGQNGDQAQFRESEVHKPYIRTTTVKTRAAFSQIMEALMQNSRFPLQIEPTPMVQGVPALVTDAPTQESQEADMADIEAELGGLESQEDFGIGYEGDGKILAEDGLSWKEDDTLYQGVNEGRDKSGGQFAQLSPAARAAEEMNKIIQDQLEESNAHTELRKTVFEACLLGTGIMKGVFTEEKVSPKWVEGKYAPETRKFPRVHNISTWDLYIDPNAMVFDEAEWTVERHRMSSKKLRDLKNRAFFDVMAIDRSISNGANWSDKSFEFTVREQDTITEKGRLWEVLEYWGYMSAEEARSHGLDKKGELLDTDQVQVNVWICGDEVLRVMANPFLPQRLPYFLMNYEVNPYNLYGVGVPETMEDSQKMMNGFARLAVDNLALAGNMVFDVDESMLIPGQDMEIHPGKIFRRQGGQSGAAVHGIKFPSTANENLQMFQEFRRQADEATGIPSVSHGQTGVSGTGRTASGLNMILENASLNIKTVIRNIDDDLLQPLGKMLFYWNNQFNSENLPKGDMDVVATGVRSYTKQEVKIQRLQTLLGLVQNPAIAPMIKMPYIIREYVKGLDMDPNEIINDMDEAKIYAAVIGMAGGATAQGKAAAAAQEGPAGLNGQQGNTEGAGNPGGINGTEA